LAAGLKTAWAENPALAVQFARRFQSQTLLLDTRFLLLNFPEKALDEPDALEIILGPLLPNDLSFQLKVCV
jgi:phosphatidylinositol 4-kinase